MVRFSCSHCAFLFHFFVVVLCAVFLSSLKAIADICFDFCAESLSYMAVANNVAIGAGGGIRFPSLYSVDESIRRWSLRMDACMFVVLTTCSTLIVMVRWSECERRMQNGGIIGHTEVGVLSWMIIRTEISCTCPSLVTWKTYLTCCRDSGQTDFPRRMKARICTAVATMFDGSGSPWSANIGLAISNWRFSAISVLPRNFPLFSAGKALECFRYPLCVVVMLMWLCPNGGWGMSPLAFFK